MSSPIQYTQPVVITVGPFAPIEIATVTFQAVLEDDGKVRVLSQDLATLFHELGDYYASSKDEWATDSDSDSSD